MSEVFKKAEREKTLELARRYLAKGYAVRDRDGKFGRPMVFGGVKPDLVVRKGGKTIIVEIKSKASLLKNLRTVRQLSKYAEERPGYRFDLVVANPPSISRLVVQALRREQRRREAIRRLSRKMVRSSVSGRFVKRSYGKQHPRTTEIETVGRRKRHKKGC